MSYFASDIKYIISPSLSLFRFNSANARIRQSSRGAVSIEEIKNQISAGTEEGALEIGEKRTSETKNTKLLRMFVDKIPTNGL